jgi:hypothetical protein
MDGFPPSHSKSDQWTTGLRIKNRGPETISIERLCELNLTETDGPMIQNYENARVILTPVRPGPTPILFEGGRIETTRLRSQKPTCRARYLHLAQQRFTS